MNFFNCKQKEKKERRGRQNDMATVSEGNNGKLSRADLSVAWEKYKESFGGGGGSSSSSSTVSSKKSTSSSSKSSGVSSNKSVKKMTSPTHSSSQSGSDLYLDSECYICFDSCTTKSSCRCQSAVHMNARI